MLYEEATVMIMWRLWQSLGLRYRIRRYHLSNQNTRLGNASMAGCSAADNQSITRSRTGKPGPVEKMPLGLTPLEGPLNSSGWVGVSYEVLVEHQVLLYRRRPSASGTQASCSENRDVFSTLNRPSSSLPTFGPGALNSLSKLSRQ